MESGWLSILPPLVAIVLAILTRRVLLSLGLSILVGGMLLAMRDKTEMGFFAGVFDSAWNDHLWPAFLNKSHLQVFLFSVTLGAMVGVIEAGGGMESLVHRLTKRVKGRRGGQVLVWLMGLAVFFDDYANTLLLGTTMRTAADRLRFSRAKLAYLVDSTAAPVAGLAIVSTWVATEIGLIADGLESANVSTDVTAFAIFVQSMPYRFYAALALVMVAVIAWSGRDFGPMLACEREAQNSGGAGSESEASDNLEPSDPYLSNLSETREPNWLWATAVVPVLICVGTVLAFLVWTGVNSPDTQPGTGLKYWGQVIGNADSYISLVWGSAIGLATALLLGISAMRSSGRTYADLAWGLVKGAYHILPAMLILWLAWSLSNMTDGVQTENGVVVAGPFLDTGGYFEGLLRSSELPGWSLPTAVFVIAGFVALSTGTSWGTMAILTPLSVQLAVAAAVIEAEASGLTADAVLASGGALLVPTVGAVLAGAIFGDHCSPISDTTVLSSRASGCDHIQHVRTQLPYALSVGLITIVVGTLPSGWGWSPWLSLGLGSLAILAMVRFFGKHPET